MRRWLFGAGAAPFTRAAIALLVVGVLFVLVEAQSSSKVFWTGEAVTGTNSGGIVFYRVDGEQYTLDAPGPAQAKDVPVTVYVNPDDPTDARLDGPTRWIDAGTVLVWFVGAGLCLGVGLLRQARRRRRQPAGNPAADVFGQGFSSADVQRHVRSRTRTPGDDARDRAPQDHRGRGPA